MTTTPSDEELDDFAVQHGNRALYALGLAAGRAEQQDMMVTEDNLQLATEVSLLTKDLKSAEQKLAALVEGLHEAHRQARITTELARELLQSAAPDRPPG